MPKVVFRDDVRILGTAYPAGKPVEVSEEVARIAEKAGLAEAEVRAKGATGAKANKSKGSAPENK